MRTLGIDYGTARIGLALSDELGMIATPFRALQWSQRIVREIVAIVEAEQVGQIVVGMPYDLRGNETDTTRKVKEFVEELRKSVSCEVFEQDEALSSRKAVSRMVEAGVKKSKRREKERTDMWAAAIILQDFLDGG